MREHSSQPGDRPEQCPQEQGGQNGPDDLSGPESGNAPPRKAAARGKGERDGGIEMRPRGIADGVNRGHDDEGRSDGAGRLADFAAVHSCNHLAARCREGQGERSQRLGQ